MFIHPSRCPLTLTALPLGVAHPEVAAHAGGALLGALGAADVLDLLAQALEGGVHLLVAVALHVGVVGSVASSQGVGALLLLGLGEEVHAGARGTSRSWGSGRSRRTLEVARGWARVGFMVKCTKPLRATSRHSFSILL